MAVFGLVSAVAGFVKVRYLIDKAIIDNMVFRAHYRITAAILFACCIIVTANNLIGECFDIFFYVLLSLRMYILYTLSRVAYVYTVLVNFIYEVGFIILIFYIFEYD